MWSQYTSIAWCRCYHKVVAISESRWFMTFVHHCLCVCMRMWNIALLLSLPLILRTKTVFLSVLSRFNNAGSVRGWVKLLAYLSRENCTRLCIGVTYFFRILFKELVFFCSASFQLTLVTSNDNTKIQKFMVVSVLELLESNLTMHRNVRRDRSTHRYTIFQKEQESVSCMPSTSLGGKYYIQCVNNFRR